MKYCPTCETRYDEDILRFCMKDGTPLIDEDDEPNFIAMPSESLAHAEDDEPEDVTIVRKSTPPIPPPAAAPVFPPPTPQPRPDAGGRIVVSTEPEIQRPAAQGYRSASSGEPPRSNTFKVVVLTVFGTLFVLAIGALGFWGLQKLAGGSDANSNINANSNLANENTNVNTNLGIDSNFNFNTDGGYDTNSNTNEHAKTPSPTPTASPTPRPSPSPTATPDRDDDDGDDHDDHAPQPTPTPVRVRTPPPTPTPLIIRPAPDTRRTPNVRRSDDDN